MKPTDFILGALAALVLLTIALLLSLLSEHYRAELFGAVCGVFAVAISVMLFVNRSPK